jgi:hypothetical protein
MKLSEVMAQPKTLKLSDVMTEERAKAPAEFLPNLTSMFSMGQPKNWQEGLEQGSQITPQDVFTGMMPMKGTQFISEKIVREPFMKSAETGILKDIKGPLSSTKVPVKSPLDIGMNIGLGLQRKDVARVALGQAVDPMTSVMALGPKLAGIKMPPKPPLSGRELNVAIYLQGVRKPLLNELKNLVMMLG